MEAQADFDPKAFVESKFLDTSDPVGSILTTGGPDRYIDQNWNYNNGLRKKSLTGAQIELSQKIGYENSNSLYFMPPLARNGEALAEHHPAVAERSGNKLQQPPDRARADRRPSRRATKSPRICKTILLDVYQAYWDLHLQRALLLQKRKLYDRGVEICRKLEGRHDIDARGGQLARAKAAVASRYGAVIRQETDLLNADAKLRTLINDPNLLHESRSGTDSDATAAARTLPHLRSGFAGHGAPTIGRKSTPFARN